jgi:hypothetical protein
LFPNPGKFPLSKGILLPNLDRPRAPYRCAPDPCGLKQRIVEAESERAGVEQSKGQKLWLAKVGGALGFQKPMLATDSRRGVMDERAVPVEDKKGSLKKWRRFVLVLGARGHFQWKLTQYSLLPNGRKPIGPHPVTCFAGHTITTAECRTFPQGLAPALFGQPPSFSFCKYSNVAVKT